MNDRDDALRASLECKIQIIRDRVQGVAEGYTNGLYLWGEGGTSKSFTVEGTLQKLGRPNILTNSRLTGKGLFQLLHDHPDLVHVLEDVETMFSDKNSFGSCAPRSGDRRTSTVGRRGWSPGRPRKPGRRLSSPAASFRWQTVR